MISWTSKENLRSEFFEGYHVTPQDVYSKKVTVVGLAAQAGLLKKYRVNQEREHLLASALGRLSFHKFQAMDSFYADDLTPDPEGQRHFGALFISGGKNHALHVFLYVVGEGLG